MKILFALDGSNFSQSALQSVVSRPWPTCTEVKVIHVLELPLLLMGREAGGNGREFEAFWSALRGRGEELAEKAAQKLRDANFDVSTEVVEGDPKSRIIDVAEQWRADMIVVGSHGWKGLKRFLMGSVSQAVVRHAHCTVEVVREAK